MVMSQETQAKIERFIDERREEQEAFLAELIKVPSDNPPGDCRAIAERTAELLAGLGFEVERHPVPEASVRAAGVVAVTNLVVRRRFGDGPTVALNAHGDVVPPGEGWTKEPYGGEVVDGWMYGRGVAVSKSDIATYAYALLALEAAGPALAGAIELHLTYDEEAGGEIGPKWLLEQGVSRPDYAIGPGFSYGVVTAHNGCLHLEVEILGRSAHAALPASGIDALEAATGVLSALYEHRRSYGDIRSRTPGIECPSLVIGLIEGGINTNVVPDRVVFRLDRRMIPEEDADQVERRLRAVIEEAVGRRPGVRCTIRRTLLARPLTPQPGSERLAVLLCHHASRLLGEEVRAHGVPLYTDGRHYAEAGIPTVLYGAGPHTIEEANAHRADERLPLVVVPKATTVVALALVDLLGS
jgi:succinyl-diaminopimelate desuccinylase